MNTNIYNLLTEGSLKGIRDAHAAMVEENRSDLVPLVISLFENTPYGLKKNQLAYVLADFRSEEICKSLEKALRDPFSTDYDSAILFAYKEAGCMLNPDLLLMLLLQSKEYESKWIASMYLDSYIDSASPDQRYIIESIFQKVSLCLQEDSPYEDEDTIGFLSNVYQTCEIWFKENNEQ